MSEQEEKKIIAFSERVKETELKTGTSSKGPWQLFIIRCESGQDIVCRNTTAEYFDNHKAFLQEGTKITGKVEVQYNKKYMKDNWIYHSEYPFNFFVDDAYFDFMALDTETGNKTLGALEQKLNYEEQQIISAKPDNPKSQQKQDSKNTPPKNNSLSVRANAPIQQKEKTTTLDKEVIKEGSFYNVKGKKIPDARRIQQEVNQLTEKTGRVLCTETIEASKDRNKAWARVRVIDKDTGQYTEAFVVHHYVTLFEVFILDLINQFESGNAKELTQHPIQEFNQESGKFILTPQANRLLFTRMIRFKQFAERDAESKAARRAQDKMLNREWRTKEEIEYEKLEIEMVQAYSKD